MPETKTIAQRSFAALVSGGLTVLLSGGTAALADAVPPYDYATPIFGLAAAPDGSLLIADYGAGIVELRRGEGKLIAGLPTVSDVAPIGRGDMFAVTGKDPTGLNGSEALPGVARQRPADRRPAGLRNRVQP